MRIAFLTNIPSPYRVDFFNELGKYCDLTVLFEKSFSVERDKSWADYSFKNFKGIILEGKSIATDMAFASGILKYLKKDDYDSIIVSNPFTPTGILAVMYMKIRRIRYWIEGDGAFPKKDPFFKKILKTVIIKNAEGCFSTSKTHDQYYLCYGAKKERIYRYPFTSVNEENVVSTPTNNEEKKLLREKLDMQEEKIIISVGQFIHRKGFDILLEAAKHIDRSVGIYIIGGKPTEAMEEYVSKNKLSNVHFREFINPEKLREIYNASDVFVLPTREDIWGLVVNEAMAAGLPVITTNRCVSGLEMVTNGKNGYIVPAENPEELHKAMIKVLESGLETMPKKALETAAGYTIQKMVKAHLEILQKP